MITTVLMICSALVFGEKDGYGDVSKASAFRNKKQMEEGAAFVSELRKRPREKLTPVEIQAEDMAEFSLWRDDPAHREQCIELLKKAYAQGPETIWGWSALGFLDNFGAKDAVKMPKKDPYLHLGDIAKDVLDFEPKRIDDAKRTVAVSKWRCDKSDILRTQLLDLYGKTQVDEKLFSRLWNDDKSVADFLLSGPIFEPKQALESLMTMYLNDPDGWCMTEEGRKITIATAINARPLGKKDNADTIMTNRLKCWAAYRRLSQRKLFHETTAKRDTREWRFIVRDPTSPADILYLNSRPYNYKRPGQMIYQVHYRHNNCFGDYIFGPNYYKPWRFSDWPYWYMVHRVGGICNRQSTFAAVCSNAHGLMAERAGQPNHCAWLLRDEKGMWNIKNDINKYTAGVFYFWGHGYQYIQATERAFASREKWDKSELLRFQKRYKESISACPYNLSAWRDYTDFLKAQKTSAAEWKKYLSVVARAMPDGRTATWDLAFEGLEAYRKAGASDNEVRDEAIALVKALPEPEKRIPEEMNYGGEVMRRMGKLFKDDKERLFKVLVVALEANWGTRTYFTQVLRYGLDTYQKDTEMCNRYVDAFGKIAKHHEKKGEEMDAKGLDWRALISATSVGHQRDAFQTLATLRNRLQPPPEGTPYPEKDFGGRLVSAKGVFYTSGRVKGDAPEDYPRVIDASPLKPKRPYQVATKPVESPWAIVELQGMCKISGVRVTGDKMVQTVISISEDGESWTVVQSDDATERAETRVAFQGMRPKAKFVKISRAANATTEPMRLSKVLVYGDTLY